MKTTQRTAAPVVKLLSKLFGRREGAGDVEARFPAISRSTSGVVIGAKDSRPLVDTTMDPVAVVGSCRSGKTSAVVVPTLLTWRESAIVYDVHGERFGITERWRRTGAGNRVHRLDFSNPDSPDTFNLLDAIPRGTMGEVMAIEALSAALLSGRDDDDRLTERGRDDDERLAEHGRDDDERLAEHGRDDDDRLAEHARALLSLFIIAKRPSHAACLQDVGRALSHSATFEATVAYFRDLEPDNDLDCAGKEKALGFSALSVDERAAVHAVVTKSLAIFAWTPVGLNTRRSSFDLAELRDGEVPMTVYLSSRGQDAEQLGPVHRAFLMLVVGRSTELVQSPAKYRLLLALDDFDMLGHVPLLDSGLAYLSGHGIKALLTFQSLAGRERQVGKTMWERSLVRIVLPRIDRESAAIVADNEARLARVANASGTTKVKGLPPITAEDVLRLGKGQEVILGAAARPIRVAAFPYYGDADMMNATRAHQA